MRLSIVIVNWNTTTLLADCVRSIRKHPPQDEHEVIVVDNASDDFDAAGFCAEFPQVRLISNADNAGYARGNNQAIEASTGDYVLLLNPDTQVTEGALDALVDFMQSHPAAAAGARLVRPSAVVSGTSCPETHMLREEASRSNVERSVRGFPYPLAIACEFLGLSKLFPKSRKIAAYRMPWFAYDTEAEVDQPMGSALILSRKAINEIGLMDEAFPIFFNEVDWLYRARQAGYKVYFTPSATIIHYGAGSTSQVDRRKMIRESHDSLIRFYAKHFRGKLFAPVYYFTLACIRVGALVRR